MYLSIYEEYISMFNFKEFIFGTYQNITFQFIFMQTRSKAKLYLTFEVIFIYYGKSVYVFLILGVKYVEGTARIFFYDYK